ncbi:condensation domain-containing protein [Nonomuraea sp. NPDC050643]|uniref:condensation domain-containing protein n=1 Tax=Nonomuraea sp. NPDC050643 TaxID=3155660 RepID=UPI0033E1785A
MPAPERTQELPEAATADHANSDFGQDESHVFFTGARAGTWPATFTQANVLAWLPGDPTSAVLSDIVKLPPRVSVDDIRAALEVLVSRHESLRTIFPATEGEPVQQVLGAGLLPVRFLPILDGTTPDRTTQAMWQAEPFDHASELPLRVTVYLDEGRPALMRLDVSHVAADQAAAELIERDLLDLLVNPETRVVGPPRRQPVDQARDERSIRGTRRLEATLRYWSEQLRRLPLCVMALPVRQDADAGHLKATLTSAAAAEALTKIAARTSASRSTVVLTCLAMVLAWWTDSRTLKIHATCSNRFLLGARDYVGTIAQETLVPFTADHHAFDDLVRHMTVAAVTAYRYGHYDAPPLIRATEEVMHERGMYSHRDVVVNDVSAITDAPGNTIHPHTSAGSRIEVTSEPFRPEPVRLTVVRLASRLEVDLSCDSRLIPRETMEELLRGAELVLLAAADGDVLLADLAALARIRPVARGPEWTCIDGNWIDVAAVQRIVAGELRHGVARVFTVPDGAGRPLVAYLTSQDEVDLGELHAACVARLGPEEHGVMTPQWYVVVASAPDDTEQLASWRRRSVLREGSGRVSPGTGTPEPR